MTGLGLAAATHAALEAIATAEADRSRGHFGRASLAKLEVVAVARVADGIKVHFVFDLHDWVVSQAGSDCWMHRIFAAWAQLATDAPELVVAHHVQEWRAILVNEVDEDSYDWDAAMAAALAWWDQHLREGEAP